MTRKKLHGPVRHIDPASEEGRRIIAAAGRLLPEGIRELAVHPPERSRGQGEPPQNQPVARRYEYAPACFADWLAVYFISMGRYRITDRGMEFLSGGLPALQSHEFREHYTSRRRDERFEERGLTKKQEAALVARKIKQLLDEGAAGYLYENGYLARPKQLEWKDEAVRVAVSRKLVGHLGKDVRKITLEDFKACGLGGLAGRYGDSPIAALAEAGYVHGKADYVAHAAGGRFDRDKAYPWEFHNPRIYDDAETRASATLWLIWKTGKDPRELTQDDFVDNGLSGLVQIYRGSPYEALAEAGKAHKRSEIASHSAEGRFDPGKIYPWQMNNVRIYEGLEMRAAAVRWLQKKIAKDARDITTDDFIRAGLQGLLAMHYGGSPYLAVLEAGLVEAKDEEYMRRHGAGRFVRR